MEANPPGEAARINLGLALVARIRLLKTDQEAGRWEAGRLYSRILASTLWNPSQHASAEEFLTAELNEIAPAVLGSWARVASKFGRPAVSRHGMEKLAYFVTYETLCHGEFVGGVDPENLEIRFS